MKPHFKVHCSVRNHRKTHAMWRDPKLRGIWVELGRLATERWADSTDDSFLCSSLDLQYATGTSRPSGALKAMASLVRDTSVTVEREGGGWRVTFPNFAKKQGFKPGNVRRTVPLAASAITATAAGGEKPPDPPPRSTRNEGERRPETPITGRSPEDAESPAPGGDRPGAARKRQRAPGIEPHPPPAYLPPDQLAQLVKWASRDFPQYTERQVHQLADACLDHFRSKPKVELRPGWLASCRNWIRREPQFHPEGPGGARVPGKPVTPFDELPPDEQESIRELERRRQKHQKAKTQLSGGSMSAGQWEAATKGE